MSMLENGFISPYIQFIFDADNARITIDSEPPTFFMAMDQVRTVDKACTFKLTLMYPVGNFGESSATILHSILLGAKGKRVEYRYGYIKPGGIPVFQNATYTGIFTTYDETLNDGYLTYVISGISKASETSSNIVKVSNLINGLKGATGNSNAWFKPSMLIDYLTSATGHYMFNVSIAELCSSTKRFFDDYSLQIDRYDTAVHIDSYNVPDGSLIDVLRGHAEPDGSLSSNGIASYGYVDASSLAESNGELTHSQIQQYNNAYDTLVSHGDSMNPIIQNVGNVLSKYISKYTCFFDSVVTDGKKGGTFYYAPVKGRETSSVFTYNYGNKFIDSDVLSINASYDCAPALALVGSTKEISSGIDLEGNNVGSNFNSSQIGGFSKSKYNSLSGFESEQTLTNDRISRVLNFPINISMTIMGQTENINRLLDRITLNVFVNGVQHPVLTGKYIITGIEDKINATEGFITSFELTKYTGNEEVAHDKFDNFVSNSSDTVKAVQDNCKDDYLMRQGMN